MLSLEFFWVLHNKVRQNKAVDLYCSLVRFKKKKPFVHLRKNLNVPWSSLGLIFRFTVTGFPKGSAAKCTQKISFFLLKESLVTVCCGGEHRAVILQAKTSLWLACSMACVWFGLNPLLATVAAKWCPGKGSGTWGSDRIVKNYDGQLGSWSPECRCQNWAARRWWPAFVRSGKQVRDSVPRPGQFCLVSCPTTLRPCLLGSNVLPAWMPRASLRVPARSP